MDLSLISLEIGVALIGVIVLLVDLWTPEAHKKRLGWLVVIGLVGAFAFELKNSGHLHGDDTMGFQRDSLTIFFHGFFIMAGILVTLLTISYADRIRRSIGELYALICFALTGMLFAAGSTSFVMLFVSVELVTITFYILTSFEAHRLRSLEAGVKYLILGAASSGVMVFGIALIYGSTGELGYTAISQAIQDPNATEHVNLFLFSTGIVLVLAGLAFKVAAVPFQLWVPDVYQGAPTPVTAFLSAGSKAAGFVLLIRMVVLHEDVVHLPIINMQTLLAVMAGATILYGSLCALRQRNLKRLLGYSSIASAGYALLGVVALNAEGIEAVLYYLAGYLFAVLAAFTIIAMVTDDAEDEDISVLANLHQRSPLFAVTLTLAIVSMAGIPPLAGFFGKFLLLKSAMGVMDQNPVLPWVVGIAIVGVVISLYYYFGVIREIYWGSGRFWAGDEEKPKTAPIECPDTADIIVMICVFWLLALGLYPEPVMSVVQDAALGLFASELPSP